MNKHAHSIPCLCPLSLTVKLNLNTTMHSWCHLLSRDVKILVMHKCEQVCQQVEVMTGNRTMNNNAQLYIISLAFMWKTLCLETWARGYGCTKYCFSNLGATRVFAVIITNLVRKIFLYVSQENLSLCPTHWRWFTKYFDRSLPLRYSLCFCILSPLWAKVPF